MEKIIKSKRNFSQFLNQIGKRKAEKRKKKITVRENIKKNYVI